MIETFRERYQDELATMQTYLTHALTNLKETEKQLSQRDEYDYLTKHQTNGRAKIDETIRLTKSSAVVTLVNTYDLLTKINNYKITIQGKRN